MIVTSALIAAIIWKHYRKGRNDRWDRARVYLGDRDWILNGNHSPAIVAIGSYPRMHSKLFNTVVFMEEMIKIRLFIQYV